jgi:hypothetical protein
MTISNTTQNLSALSDQRLVCFTLGCKKIL